MRLSDLYRQKPETPLEEIVPVPVLPTVSASPVSIPPVPTAETPPAPVFAPPERIVPVRSPAPAAFPFQSVPPPPAPREAVVESDDLPVRAEDAGTRALYQALLSDCFRLFSQLEQGKVHIQLQEILTDIDQMTRAALSGDPAILLCTAGVTTENYLVSHAVNSAIYTARLASASQWRGNELLAVVLGSYFHDVGLLKYRSIIFGKGPLRPQDRGVIRNHPAEGAELLKRHFPGQIPRITLQMIEQSHRGETEIGAGPPLLQWDHPNDPLALAQICDIYEQLTHPRPYAALLTPHHAVGRMLTQTRTPAMNLTMKRFVQIFSMYPVGSLVRLNTGETGIVTRTFEETPTRPGVFILLDLNGNEALRHEVVSLPKCPLLHIREAMTLDQLVVRDAQYLTRLGRMFRWPVLEG